MKFRFCGDLDVPDFVLLEIDTLAKISSLRVKLVVSHVISALVKPDSKFKYAKITDVLQKSGLSPTDASGVVAGLEFIIRSAAKHECSESILRVELNQCGLPKEHCDVLGKAYEKSRAEITAAMAEKTLRLPQITHCDWRVDKVLASSRSSAASEIDATIAHVRFAVSSPNANGPPLPPITVAMTTDQLDALIADLETAKKQMDAIAAI